MKYFHTIALIILSLVSLPTVALERPTANNVQTFQELFTQSHNDAHTCAAFLGQFNEIPTSATIEEIDISCGRMFFGLSILLDADKKIAEQVINTEAELKELIEIVETMEVTHSLVTKIGIQHFPIITAVAVDLQTRKLSFI